jgi:hypothetical protein
MIETLSLKGNQYNLLLSIFFVPYVIFLSQKAEKRCSQNVRDEKDAKKEIVLISLQ